MESFSRDIENQEMKSIDRQDFDEEKTNQEFVEIQEEKAEDRKQREPKMVGLKYKLNENADIKEKVSEFIRDNCSEPIGWVEKVVPYQELAKILLEDAQNEVNKADEKIGKSSFLWKLKPWIRKRKSQQILDSIKNGNAKDKRIYQLPAYKDLIKKWFILPSDVRNYYDSANKEPVYHLWVDYNVKWGTEVKSIYKWKVVNSWWDGWLWHKVVIEHEMNDWTKFYSLYGHLGSKNLPKVGDKIEIWTKIWEVWKEFSEENWNWNSHLHFQIMENVDSPKWYSKQEWEWNYDVLKSFGK